MGAMDKVKDKVEELKGQAKQKMGDATDNDDMKSEGKMDETKGKLKQKGEQVKDVFKG